MKLIKTIIEAEKLLAESNNYDESLSDISNEFLRFKRNYDCPFCDKKSQIILDFIATNVMLPMFWRNNISIETINESFRNGLNTIATYLEYHDNNYFFVGPKYLDEIIMADLKRVAKNKEFALTCVEFAVGMLRILKKYSTDIQERYMD